MTRWTVLAILTLVVIGAAVALVVLPSPAAAPTDGVATSTPQAPATLDDLIAVTAPLPGAAVSSPLTITGKARGSFYFEASFPVMLADWDGKIIAQGHATAQGDWMTGEYVPFTATLTYTTPAPGDPSNNRGTLILKNDNPSGDPARSKTLEVPVVFK